MCPHVVLQEYGGTDFVDECFILTGLLAQSAVDHGLMCQNGSEPLVVCLNGNLRHGFAPSPHELHHALPVLAGLAICLAWLTDDYSLHFLAGSVVLQPVEKFMGSDSHQSACNDLQRIGDCQSGTFTPVVYG